MNQTGSAGPKARSVEDIRILGRHEVELQQATDLTKQDRLINGEDESLTGRTGRQILATLVVAEQLAGIRETLEKIAITGALGLLAQTKVTV